MTININKKYRESININKPTKNFFALVGMQPIKETKMKKAHPSYPLCFKQVKMVVTYVEMVRESTNQGGA